MKTNIWKFLFIAMLACASFACEKESLVNADALTSAGTADYVEEPCTPLPAAFFDLTAATNTATESYDYTWEDATDRGYYPATCTLELLEEVASNEKTVTTVRIFAGADCEFGLEFKTGDEFTFARIGDCAELTTVTFDGIEYELPLVFDEDCPVQGDFEMSCAGTVAVDYIDPYVNLLVELKSGEDNNYWWDNDFNKGFFRHKACSDLRLVETTTRRRVDVKLYVREYNNVVVEYGLQLAIRGKSGDNTYYYIPVDTKKPLVSVKYNGKSFLLPLNFDAAMLEFSGIAKSRVLRLNCNG